MTTAALKRAAVVAMTEFGLSDRPQPSEAQTRAVDDYLEASRSGWQQRMMCVLRVSVRCVGCMTFTQHTKVLLWLREHALRG